MERDNYNPKNPCIIHVIISIICAKEHHNIFYNWKTNLQNYPKSSYKYLNNTRGRRQLADIHTLGTETKTPKIHTLTANDSHYTFDFKTPSPATLTLPNHNQYHIANCN